jgi:hypothetical protein
MSEDANLLQATVPLTLSYPLQVEPQTGDGSAVEAARSG